MGGGGVVIVLIFEQTHISGTSTLLLSPPVRVRLGQGGSDILNLHHSKNPFTETSGDTSGADPPQSTLPSAASKIALYPFFNLHALFHPELIRRSVSQQVGHWPPDEGGATLEQSRRDVDHLWLYWSDVWSVIFIFLCVRVCARMPLCTQV